jgi:hypothetical protein
MLRLFGFSHLRRSYFRFASRQWARLSRRTAGSDSIVPKNPAILQLARRALVFGLVRFRAGFGQKCFTGNISRMILNKIFGANGLIRRLLQRSGFLPAPEFGLFANPFADSKIRPAGIRRPVLRSVPGGQPGPRKLPDRICKELAVIYS